MDKMTLFSLEVCINDTLHLRFLQISRNLFLNMEYSVSEVLCYVQLLLLSEVLHREQKEKGPVIAI
jgi:hypothetical protein